jgi:hypothetical protein
VLPWFNSRVPLMVISFAASSSFLSIRLGRWELFAQRETAPAAHYGFIREGRGAGVLDLPYLSIAFANTKRWEDGQAN